MAFEKFTMITDYVSLKKNLKSQIKALRGRHGAITNEDLKEPRRTQVLFLVKSIELLEAQVTDNEKRAIVLNGLLLNTKYQLELEKSSKSFFEAAIPAIMGISEANRLDPATAEQLHNAALSFFKVEIMNEEGKLLEISPFAYLEKFKPKDFIERAYTLISRDGTCAYEEKERERVAAALEATKEKERVAALKEPKVSSPSYLSSLTLGWFGSSSSSSSSAKAQPNLVSDIDKLDLETAFDSDDELATLTQKK